MIKHYLLKIINKSIYFLRGAEKLWSVNIAIHVLEHTQMFYFSENRYIYAF